MRLAIGMYIYGGLSKSDAVVRSMEILGCQARATIYFVAVSYLMVPDPGISCAILNCASRRSNGGRVGRGERAREGQKGVRDITN